MSTVQICLPPKLIPVFAGEADVRYSFGGRGSGKTRSFAKMAAVQGYIHGMAGNSGMVLCARQFMNSLEDSSLEECKRAIEDEPFLAAYYEIGEKYIKSRDGRISFAFAGLDRNIASIKSKGRILLCWVDEAEPVTDAAFNILIPTLREEGEGWNAELWITWNPARKNAPVEKRFRNSKDPRVKGVELNWRDNPMFPAKLERDRLRDLAERPDEYEHIWEGGYGTIAGSILGKWVAKARSEGRIGEIEYDPRGAPLVISADIGFHDTASFWYWQPTVGGYHLPYYEGESGLDADDWIERIKENIGIMRAKLGKIWLPHDAKAKTFQSKHTTMERFIKAFGADRVGVVPMTRKLDQINAARRVIDQCAFDSDGCGPGIDGLEGWAFKWIAETASFSKDPIHDSNSHPSDGFAYGAIVMEQEKATITPDQARYDVKGFPDGKMRTQKTLDQLWKENNVKRKPNRI